MTTKNIPITAIIIDKDFIFREDTADRDRDLHSRDLAQRLHQQGNLNPVILWEERDEEGSTTGRLVLLDGRHRIAAFNTNKKTTIPATIFTGDRQSALLLALSMNSHVHLPLTKDERVNAAWRLVRRTQKMTVKAIANAASVGPRTVDRMRKRWKTMQAEGKTPSGQWWRDMTDGIMAEPEPEMTNKQRREAIAAHAETMKTAFGKLPWKDEHLFAEALQAAVGTYKLKCALDYLYAEPEDEFESEDGEEVEEKLGPTAPLPEPEIDAMYEDHGDF